MNKENYYSKLFHYNLVKTDPFKNSETYSKFINWVSCEFDLFIQYESKNLKVYFPNGWFVISNFKDKYDRDQIEIRVEGKSKIACQNIIHQLEIIFNHVVFFIEAKLNKCL